MWSKCVWVSRIASTPTPISSIAPRIRSGSSPGSTTSARSEPSRRKTKQFSATWPTVSMRTSMGDQVRARDRAAGLGLALLGFRLEPLLLFPAQLHPVEEAVHVVAHRDVDEQHEGRQAERLQEGLAEEQDE